MLTPRHLLSALALTGLATLPASAQRLGKPTYSQEDPDQQQRIERDRASASTPELGEVTTELVVKAGEKGAVVLSAGADGATVANGVAGAVPRNAVTFALSVKGDVSTLRVDNRSGGLIGFKIEADPSGSGAWAQAGEVKDLRNQQTSNTDYQLKLSAVRITAFTMTAKK